MPFLQFFIFLGDQPNFMGTDKLGPVSVEFFERKIDGTDTALPVRVEGSAAFTASLSVPGATQLFNGENPLANISATPAGEGVLVSSWKPWAEVWAEYEQLPAPPLPGPPPPIRHRRVRKRIEIQRPAPQGNFDLYLVVKRTIDGADREIGRSELYRNCKDDLSNLIRQNGESAVWISVPSVGQESLPFIPVPPSKIEYARVRAQTADVLKNEKVNLSGLSDAAVEEVAAQTVGGLDTLGLPPDSPAKKLYDPDSNSMHELKVHGLRLAQEALVQQRTSGIDQATRDRKALVAALKTGFECQRLTSDTAAARRFHWWIPIDPAVWTPGNPNDVVRVEVYSIPVSMLEVPAAYFYALTRDLEPSTPWLERYNMAAGGIEDNLRAKFRQAEIRKVIGSSHTPITDGAAIAGPALSHRLAARRLHGLPRLNLDGRPDPGTDDEAVDRSFFDCRELFSHWLSSDMPDEEYWQTEFLGLDAADPKRLQHLRIVLRATCADISKPGAAIPFLSHLKADPAWGSIANVSDLKSKSEKDWGDLFKAYWGVGDAGREQHEKLIRNIRRYLQTTPTVAAGSPSFVATSFAAAPGAEGLKDFFAAHPAFSFDPPTTVASIRQLVTSPDVIEQLVTLHFLYRIVGAGAPNLVPEMEALYFRGFTDPWPIARLTPDQFRAALIGTLAYADADAIRNRAVALTRAVPLEYPEPEGDRDPDETTARAFRPVNHDGLLTDCIPPDHLSPFGPASYVQSLLKTPHPDGAISLGDAITDRRGPLGQLNVTSANSFTPVPVIDLVNEALESLVSNAQPDIDAHPNGELAPGVAPAIFQTSDDTSADMLVAVPEHSTPSAPDPVTEAAAHARQKDAYDRLKEDFSSFERPYHQPLDITRTYLEHMGTRRYETMRTFRKDIHEFVKQPQDMANPKAFTPFLPPEFDTQTHLRRYPVRIDTAREYLKISEDEHREVFTGPLGSSRQKLWQFWGYRSDTTTGHNDTPELAGWTDDHPEVIPPDANPRPAGARRLAAFLRRSSLSYDEFRDLVACGFVPIAELPALPAEEPCDIGAYSIDFAPLGSEIALERLAVFIRLRRILQKLPHTSYTFEGITDRLNKARQQMLGWGGARASITSVRKAVQSFVAAFENAGATPIAEDRRNAAHDAIVAAFQDLFAANAGLAAARAPFAGLRTRLERLVLSSNRQVTDEIRDLAYRVLASIAAQDVAQNSFQNITNQVGWIADGILDGKDRQSLMELVRELRVSIADFADNLDSLAQLTGSIVKLRDLLPVTAIAIIKQAKTQAADIVPQLQAVPGVQAALTVAGQNLEVAVADWAPVADQNAPSEETLQTLTEALRSEARQLRLFPSGSKLPVEFLDRLHRLPQAGFSAAAVTESEDFLKAFNADRLQDEIRDGLLPIGAKIDTLPAAFTDIASARADLQALVELIDAEPQDGAFAIPLAEVGVLTAWWTQQAAKDHSFISLKHICDVLGLYRDPPAPAPPAEINADFVRQLAAMQMLRDDFGLCLTDVLPLWLPAPGGVEDPLTTQAKKDLADVIQERADCLRKEPKSSRLLSDHFDDIADLTSLRADPGNDSYPAFLQPTHTLRFVEVCFKLAHSEFSVGEVSFLYLNRHPGTPEDDPFRVEDDAAILEQQPFADEFSGAIDASMLRLQRLLRGASYASILSAFPDGKAADGQPSWSRANGDRKTLESRFGFAEADLLRLDRAFAPARQPGGLWPVPSGTGGLVQTWEKLADCLTRLGYADLAALHDLLTLDSPPFTSDLPEPRVTRFTTPPAGKKYDFRPPLTYDAAAGKLAIDGLLTPEEILAEVTRYRKSDGTDLGACSDDEVRAIRDLYEQPRRTLARFVLILPDQREAARRLLTPKTAAERMKVFVRYYFIFLRQYFVTADHLASHVLQREPMSGADDELDALSATALYLLLHHIEADENWKDNTGAFHYPDNPNARAIAGILGLRGTGIWSEFLSFKPSGDYTDVFGQRYDKYVARVPGVPAGDPTFVSGNYEKLPQPGAGQHFPGFPNMAGLAPATGLVREISGSLNYLDHPNDEFGDPVDRNTNDWLYNAPKPLRIPEPVNHVFDLAAPLPGDEKPVELRSGYEIRNADAADRSRTYGGAVPYLVRWTGKLQVTTAGEHRFVVCFKLPAGEKGPLGSTTITSLTDNAMRIDIKGAATALMVEVSPEHKDAPNDSDALQQFGGTRDGIFHTSPVTAVLDAGQYDIELSFVDYSVDPSVIEVSKGPSVSKDRHVAWIGVFVESREVRPLSEKAASPIAASRSMPKSPPPPPAAEAGNAIFVELLAQSLFIPVKEQYDFAPDRDGAFFYPEPYYFSSIRDIRRTYQRTFKALLFCQRFGLACDEVAFLLGRGPDFRGIAFTRESGAWQSRKLDFDFNQWSVGDAFRPRAEANDIRQYPETHMAERVWPLFDQWERFHDYVLLRAEARTTTGAEAPLWNLFRDATDTAVPPAAEDLVRLRLGLNEAVAADALLYTTDASPDFDVIDKAALKTEEWAVRVWEGAQWQYARLRQFAANVVAPTGYRDWAKLAPDVVSLRDYINGAYLENGPVRRYANLEQLNAGLRERGRDALIGYLTSLDRCRFPQAAGALPFARSARDLSERLLLDVETGSCGATPRIEEASAALRTLVQRLRLGLEAMSPDDISPRYLETWDLRYAEYRRWQACRYQAVYAENYREADLIRVAAGTEAFQFLERQLPELDLTVEENWADLTPPLLPAIPGLIRWSDRLPSIAEALPSQPQGYRKLDKRERADHRTALSSARANNSISIRETNSMRLESEAPLEMDGRFIRLQCTTTAWQDDFYFWLVDGVAYDEKAQDAAWDWEQPINRDDYLAGIPSNLLTWKSRKTVRLAWCRVRDDIEEDVRISDYGIPLGEDGGELTFDRRDGDLLIFKVVGAAQPGQRFVYDPGENLVHILTAWTVAPAPGSGGLPSFPHFIAVAPGAPAGPVTFHAPVLLVQKHLRLQDRGDAARSWLEFLYKPLARSNGWLDPEGVAARPDSRVLLLNWIETVLDIGEAQLSRNRLSTTELSRETLALVRKVLGETPRRIVHQDGTGLVDLAGFVPKEPPLNRRVVSLWARVDRLAAEIRRCENSRQIRNARTQPQLVPSPGTLPAYGYGRLNEGWMWRPEYDGSELDRDEWLITPPHYRFSFLMQKALELCAEARSFGAQLMAAFEKGDAEELALLRSRHEVQVNRLMLDVRQSQWREADWQLQALHKAREILELKKQHLEHLIRVGYNPDERAYFTFMQLAESLTLGTEAFEILAQFLLAVPEVYVGVCSMVKFVSGQKLATGAKIGASLLHMFATVSGMEASTAATSGSFARRAEEWQHQVDVLKIELEQVRRQIIAAGRRQDIALRELNIHQDTIRNSEEIQRFQQGKFTNAEHHLWVQNRLAGLYRGMFEVGLAAAKDAQTAFRYERHYSASNFLGDVAWSNYREGMTAGEQMLMALRRMEQAYLQQNAREHELSRSISVRLSAPDALVCLRLTGTCEVDLPEWLFDLELPGHYRRRIKNVAMSVLCATGPYQNVNTRLTLLSDAVRVSPEVYPEYQEQAALAGDPRFVRRYAAHQSIVTTSAQNDTGLFETSLRDERYLPFEGAGLISRWRIEIDPAANQFDPDSLTDVVLHFRYTAVDGGAGLRDGARAAARQNLPKVANPATRYLDARHDFPAQWLNLREGNSNKLSLQIVRDMFPWNRNSENLVVEGLDIFYMPEPGQAHPPTLQIRANGEPYEAMLIDQAYGPVYHGQVSLVSPLVLAGTESSSVELEFGTADGIAVPRPDVLLVSLKYFFAMPGRTVAACDRFALPEATR
ncbi:hypothetical protein NKH33_30040 [Mesorhizobium sp. M1182]|uniref:Tc toxin subunit A-related protein n=1 Tax=Mesorhizobium sp. M1182 TaxID=2957067 RepID=UPI00333DFAFF